LLSTKELADETDVFFMGVVVVVDPFDLLFDPLEGFLISS
jgi:hypothetical protein